jgi:antirestriction protein ArdC
MSRDVYQEVTDKIVDALASGSRPWSRPWSGVSTDGRPAWWPRNAATGRCYNGINVWLLLLNSYSDPRWVTFNQAKAAGGVVRKGEKGTLVTLWRPYDRVEDGETTKALVLRHFVVFNIAQIDPIDPANPPAWKTIDPIEVPINEWRAARVADVARAMAADGCSISYGGDHAFYAPARDAISLPPLDAFASEESAAATLLHEVTHATGAKSRLDREFGARFGDSSYAFEELIAEIGSAYLCAECAVDAPIAAHADYLASWLKVMRADKKAIFTASSQAAKAAEWVATKAGWRTVEGDESDATA